MTLNVELGFTVKLCTILVDSGVRNGRAGVFTPSDKCVAR